MALAEIYTLLERISAYSVYAPTLLCLFKIKALNRSLWAYFIYLIICIGSDRIGLVFVNDERVSNIIFNVFAIVECGILSFIYYCEFSERKSKILISVTFFAFLFFSIFIFLFQGKIDKADTVVSVIEACTISIYAGLYMVKFLVDRKIAKLERHYFYWINLAFLLYFSSAFLLFLNNDFLKQCTSRTAYVIWGLNLVLNSVTNIFTSIGIWMKRNTY